ncbi:hypothetical protein [Streptomyces sp. ISL-94]|uniref:hypothetical protein n=1 Tax=Streptomyces sp. ISL-94 TaxID=2819190 RepID=UPI001BEA4487|nr:hypothetical protein [Streptomyces sp. ISL-94]MBT2478363.1 hypothetical protein [Streptomyces sp. ISL-94]
MTSSQQERAPLSTRTFNEARRPGEPSERLTARASRGWNAFLARTGPLPGEDEPDTATAEEAEQ